jgi:hypothetical protein
MAERQISLPFEGPGAPTADDGSPRVAPRDEAARREVEAAVAAPSPVPRNVEPPRLDRTMISVVVLREVDRALALFPDWTHPFAGLDLNRARRSFGQAHRDGRIVISSVFVGTGALEDLEDTVRHEIAHLIVGIDERHGPRWRRVAKRLGAVPRASGRSRARDLGERMDDAPWMLVAVLDSGAQHELKPAWRRSRSYLEYRAGRGGREYRYRGQRVSHFLYRCRSTAEP